MHNRRKFIKNIAGIGAASLLTPYLGKAAIAGTKAVKDIGLQLYTVNGLMASDPKGTLEKLAAIGYKNLESAGSPKGAYYGYKPKEFEKMVSDMGMHLRSQHVTGVPFTTESLLSLATNAEDSSKIQKFAPMIAKMGKMANLRDNAQELADQAAEGGVEYLVCAAIPARSEEDMKIAVDIFNKAGEACKKAGVQFAFHNHAFEFMPVNGVTPFDYILANTDKDLVKSELDLGWAEVANQDPVAIFKKYSGRIPLWHVKDFDKASKTPVEVGAGYIDFKPIFAQQNTSGMKYFFVEQDDAPKPLENVTNSYAKVKGIVG